jgi:hypothetical protein
MWERNRGCWTGYVAGRSGGRGGCVKAITPSTNQYNILLPSYCPTVFQYWEAIRKKSALNQTTQNAHNFISSDWNKRKGEGRLHIILVWVYYQIELFAGNWERILYEAETWDTLFDLGGFSFALTSSYELNFKCILFGLCKNEYL